VLSNFVHVVVVKINPNITFKTKTIMYDEKKYSSDNSERTEENDCLGCLQHSQWNVAENFMCAWTC